MSTRTLTAALVAVSFALMVGCGGGYYDEGTGEWVGVESDEQALITKGDYEPKDVYIKDFEKPLDLTNDTKCPIGYDTAYNSDGTSRCVSRDTRETTKDCYDLYGNYICD